MRVTGARIKLETGNDHLKGLCSITFDGEFVVRDLKIIAGVNGLFVSMPHRKLTDCCYHCRRKTRLQDSYCANCGVPLDKNRAFHGTSGRVKLFADIAHPITPACREMIESTVLRAYADELELAKQPGYCHHYEDFKKAGVGDPHNR